MDDDTTAAARAHELAEPMADMLAAPLADAAAALETEPLRTAAEHDFLLGVITAFAAVYTLALGGAEGDTLHQTPIHHIACRVTGDSEWGESLSARVSHYMETSEQPPAFLAGFAVGATAGRQCCHEDAPGAAQQTLYDGYAGAVRGDTDR
ncbi:MAG: hypothetical protein BRD57_06665 [Proteobacteria bacterium SW_6_67_9]|nr:MAG: hypothetical protein BRD57_06665 [Proteobacteria bacterium SW_6_67_9]